MNLGTALLWSLLWHRPFSDFLNFRTATSFEFGNGKDALQPKTISTKWYGNIPDSPDWVPGNVWKRNIRWFWDLDHHGEIASRKKIPTLRTGLRLLCLTKSIRGRRRELDRMIGRGDGDTVDIYSIHHWWIEALRGGGGGNSS